MQRVNLVLILLDVSRRSKISRPFRQCQSAMIEVQRRMTFEVKMFIISTNFNNALCMTMNEESSIFCAVSFSSDCSHFWNFILFYLYPHVMQNLCCVEFNSVIMSLEARQSAEKSHKCWTQF